MNKILQEILLSILVLLIEFIVFGGLIFYMHRVSKTNDMMMFNINRVSYYLKHLLYCNENTYKEYLVLHEKYKNKEFGNYGVLLSNHIRLYYKIGKLEDIDFFSDKDFYFKMLKYEYQKQWEV